MVYGSLIGVGGHNQIDRFVDTVANDRTVFKIGTDFVDVRSRFFWVILIQTTLDEIHMMPQVMPVNGCLLLESWEISFCACVAAVVSRIFSRSALFFSLENLRERTDRIKKDTTRKLSIKSITTAPPV